MATISCPHRTPELRQCIGCPKAEDDIIGIVHCEGDITGRVYRDSDGDVGVIYGVRPALDDPVRFVLCWTPDGSGSGGTGQAIRIAQDRHIPVFDLADGRALARVETLVRDAPNAAPQPPQHGSAFRDVHGSIGAGGHAVERA